MVMGPTDTSETTESEEVDSVNAELSKCGLSVDESQLGENLTEHYEEGGCEALGCAKASAVQAQAYEAYIDQIKEKITEIDEAYQGALTIAIDTYIGASSGMSVLTGEPHPEPARLPTVSYNHPDGYAAVASYTTDLEESTGELPWNQMMEHTRQLYGPLTMEGTADVKTTEAGHRIEAIKSGALSDYQIIFGGNVGLIHMEENESYLGDLLTEAQLQAVADGASEIYSLFELATGALAAMETELKCFNDWREPMYELSGEDMALSHAEKTFHLACMFGTPGTPEYKPCEDANKKAAGSYLAGQGKKGAPAGAAKQFKKRVFKEQCFLLAKIIEIADYKKKVIDSTPQFRKPLPYHPHDAAKPNACLMVDGDSFGFINKLTQHPHQKTFFEMRNKDISTLVPMIRLYRVEMSKDGKDETQQEFDFKSFHPWEDTKDIIFSDKTKRGYGVGIKNFEFTYEGSNPFAVKKSIKAKLTIFANNFHELLKDRGGYRYVDLALKTGTGTRANLEGLSEEQIKEVEENLSMLNFRLKAVVGWARPNGNTTHFGNYSKKHLLNAIADSYVTLNLTPTIHEFNLDDQGRVTFVVNYLAYIDDFFDQPNFNIFADIETGKNILSRQIKYKFLGKHCENEELSTLKEKEMSDVDKDKDASLQVIIKKLLTKGRMKYINISRDQLKQFTSKGPFFEMPMETAIYSDQSAIKSMAGDYMAEANKVIDKEGEDGSMAPAEAVAASTKEPTEEEALAAKAEQAEKDKLKASVNFSAIVNNPNNEQIAFFFISDLIDIILEGIEGYLEKMPEEISEVQGIGWSKDEKNAEIKKLTGLHTQYKKLRILLGPVELVNPNGDSKFVNFGDLPVSAKYFMEWVTEKMLKKEEVVFPLSRFVKELFTSLINDFLNNDTCFSVLAKQKTRLNQAVLTSYNNKNRKLDEITDFIAYGTYRSIEGDEVKMRSIYKNPGPVGDNPPSRALISRMPQPMLNISGPPGIPIPEAGVGREINFFVFYAGRTQPTEYMNGLRWQDEERGIFHYMLGKDRGIVKTISLTKTDSKFLKEVRFEQEGYLGLEQLREVYDVNIKTYSNVKTFPGTYIFVDPHGWAPNTIADEGIYDLTQYGIGGYCMIIRSTHTFGAGTAETNITAKWVASIGAESAIEDPAAPAATAGNNEPSGHCPEQFRARAEKSKDEGWFDKIVGGVTSLIPQPNVEELMDDIDIPDEADIMAGSP